MTKSEAKIKAKELVSKMTVRKNDTASLYISRHRKTRYQSL